MRSTPEMIAADSAVKLVTLAASGDVEINVIEAKDGEAKKLPTFSFRGYTGAPMQVAGFFHPVIVDLAGAKAAERVDALINHDSNRILGQGTATITPEGIDATGTVMAEDADSERLTTLSKNGFKWQASIGADVLRREFLESGKTATVNGREVQGPLIIARESLVHEISFVRRGADSNTSAAIAASHSSVKETSMDPQFKAWLEANEIPHENLSAKAVEKLRVQWNADIAADRQRISDGGIGEAKAESERRHKIHDLTASFLRENPGIDATTLSRIEAEQASALERKETTPAEYEMKLLRGSRPQIHHFMPQSFGSNRLTSRVIEAALCVAGRLGTDEELVKKYRFTDQELQAAHDHFKHGIGLNEAVFATAEANGFRRGHSMRVTSDALRAACPGSDGRSIQAAGGFSPLDITTTVSATANKFAQKGFNFGDRTPLEISRIRSVRNFQQVTTVSLTGAGMLEELGPAGEIKHKALGEQTYTNQAATYAGMLAITRRDWINDDASVLTDAPMKLGLGAIRKLNDIFWTAWLGGEGAGFWAAGNNNLNSGAADATIAGLTATEVIFMNQTDYDGFPLGVQPWGIVCPTALKATFVALMDPQGRMTGGSSNVSDANPFKGRFQVFSSPYMSNSSYSGYSAQEWYLIANPQEMAVIEIAALDGRIEPLIEQAEADFNVLGLQMRAIADVGVSRQEKKASVLADGNAS